MRKIIVAVFILSIWSGCIVASYADPVQPEISDQSDLVNDDSKEFFALVRRLEKNKEIYDCTVYSTGEKCVATGLSVPSEEPSGTIVIEVE